MLARLHRADIIRDVFGGANRSTPPWSASSRKAAASSCFSATVPPACRTAIPQSGSTGSEVARSRQWREVGLGAQILKDLGITSIRLLTSAKLTYVGLGGFGIEIVDERKRWKAERPAFLHRSRSPCKHSGTGRWCG